MSHSFLSHRRLAPAAVPALSVSADLVLRYGLVAIILWLGAFKFTAAEAEAIRPLIGNSPLLGWLYGVLSVEGASRLIGSAEIAIAMMIAMRPVAPTVSALGSLAAVGMFATTLSFLASTPGVFVRVEGFVVPNEVGGFLIKDVFLLGAALRTAGEALGATEELPPRPLAPSAARDTLERSSIPVEKIPRFARDDRVLDVGYRAE